MDVTVSGASSPENRNRRREIRMPVLMIALLALAAFGGIGFLLAAAVILEHRSKLLRDADDPGPAPGKHAV
jgi:hypothetical protein